jgi:two-component system OmpR family response regulator
MDTIVQRKIRSLIMPSILMVEDDLQITELLEEYLDRYGLETLSVDRPSTALDKLRTEQYDLVLLDLGLPEMDGLELCKIIKSDHPQLPVIISTARHDTSDKVIAFDSGADDYIAKPYDPRELVARIQMVLKRYEQISPLGDDREVFEVDPVRMEIRQEGKTIELTQAEYEIFALFLKKKHQVISREFIVGSIDAVRWESSDRSIDVIVSRIRHKIGDDPKDPIFIRSVRGVGYKYIGP